MTGTLDLSTLPPALAVAVVVIYLVGKVLPDVLDSRCLGGKD